MDSFPRRLFLKYIILTLAVHRTSTGQRGGCTPLFFPSDAKLPQGLLQPLVYLKALLSMNTLQTAAVPTLLIVSFPFNTQPKYIYILSESLRGSFNLWPPVVVFERYSPGQVQWFKYLSATYGILAWSFLLGTRPDWKLQSFSFALWLSWEWLYRNLCRISVENKQIKLDSTVIWFCSSTILSNAQLSYLPILVHANSYRKPIEMMDPDSSWKCTEIMVRGNVSGQNRRKSRHNKYFSPWARQNMRSCLEKMWNLHSWRQLKLHWTRPNAIWSGCICFEQEFDCMISTRLLQPQLLNVWFFFSHFKHLIYFQLLSRSKQISNILFLFRKMDARTQL